MNTNTHRAYGIAAPAPIIEAIPTRTLLDEVVAAVTLVVAENPHHAEGFLPDVAINAILAGEVEPNYNEGLISHHERTLALAFGAFTSDGKWWA